MSSLFGLAEQMLSGGGSSDSRDEVRKTGGAEFNRPHHTQAPQGGFDTQQVLAHAEVEEEDQGYISNAIHHVHSNPEQHHEQVDESSLAQYGPMIISALTAVSSKSGLDVGALVSGGLGSGGGNQLMGLVMKEVSGQFTGGGGGEEKQSLMNGAAMTLTKLVAQKQLSAFTGGSNSGGLGMLAGLGKSLLG